MFKSKKTIYIILGVILALALIIYIITKIPKKEFNTFTFPPTIEVNNNTKTEKVDTITMVILNKIMGYEEMKIEIFELPDIFDDNSDTEIIAFISQIPFEDHWYKIYLKNNVSIGTLINVLSHEMVHLKQHEEGRLQVIEGKGYVWEGDTVLYSDIPYDDRPYEKEAYAEGPIIKRKLTKILYK